MIQFRIKGIKLADISTGKEKQKCSNTLKATELYTHTHTHTHTQLKRCLAFLFSAVLFVSSAFSGILPNGYTELDYIGTNHNAYILTNLTVNDFDRVTAKVRLLDNSGQIEYSLFGSRMNLGSYELGKAFYFRTFGNTYATALCETSWMDGWSTYVPTEIPLDLMINYDVKLANSTQYVKIADTTIGSNSYSYTTPISNLYPVPIFAHNYDGVISNIPHLESESIAFYNGFNVVGNFIPAKRDSDNVIGMYDIISQTFFENAGTGTFTAGPEKIATEPQESTDISEYTRLEYIENTDTQWIDTGIKPNQNTSALYSCAVIGDIKNRDVHLFGSRLSYVNQAFNLCYMNTQGNGLENIKFLSGVDFAQTRTPLITETTIKNKHNYYMSGTRLDVDGINILNFTTIDYEGSHNLWLFGLNNAETLHTQVVIQRVYGCKIWDNNILVRDFVPAKRNSDNEIGMYDTVNNMFYTNAGTGTFIAGPAICAATATVLDEQICLKDIQPNGLYLPVRYNNNKYYLMLDATHDYPIHKNSDNKLKVIVGNTTYNAHDTSVLE